MVGEPEWHLVYSLYAKLRVSCSFIYRYDRYESGISLIIEHSATKQIREFLKMLKLFLLSRFSF